MKLLRILKHPGVWGSVACGGRFVGVLYFLSLFISVRSKDYLGPIHCPPLPADIVEIKHIMLPPSSRDFKDIYVVFELMETDLHQVGEGGRRGGKGWGRKRGQGGGETDLHQVGGEGEEEGAGRLACTRRRGLWGAGGYRRGRLTCPWLGEVRGCRGRGMRDRLVPSGKLGVSLTYN